MPYLQFITNFQFCKKKKNYQFFPSFNKQLYLISKVAFLKDPNPPALPTKYVTQNFSDGIQAGVLNYICLCFYRSISVFHYKQVEEKMDQLRSNPMYSISSFKVLVLYLQIYKMLSSSNFPFIWPTFLEPFQFVFFFFSPEYYT